MVGSWLGRLRRHAALLVVVGFAVFFWVQAEARAAPSSPQRHDVVGTVATFHTRQETWNDSNGRLRTGQVYLVTTREHPANVEFRIEAPPAGGMAPGARVRFTVVGDPQPALDAAARFPDHQQRLRAVGFAVNDVTVYDASANAARASRTSSMFRLASLLCWAIALAWLGTLAARNRGQLRTIAATWRH
jgi:hypothetical protein